jgi:membrane fusion protein (multidrug efflux system)
MLTQPCGNDIMAEAARKNISALRDETAESPRPQPVAPADIRAKDRAAASDKERRQRRRDRIRWGLFGLLPLVLLAAAYVYVTGGQVMSTDDAYVQAERVGVSTDVSGIVQDVAVKDNQHVDAGQVLYRLDPRQFQIALDNAKANLAQIGLSIEAMKQDYKRMVSDIAAQQAQVDLDQTNYDRSAMLLKTATVSQAVFDQAHYTLDNDKGKLAALQQQAKVQLAKLGGNPDIVTTEHPQYRQAQAQVDEAQRQLDHTVVNAPFAGIVTNVPSIAPGKYLAASTTAFFLVDTDHVWVDAIPKETELTYVRPGQQVTVTVDTYPDAEWHGVVESVSPAAAQEFALLPAQNTSGNWVKVVQRVPMRVRLDTSDKNLPPLRAGMSVEVDVDTGHARGLPYFLKALFGGAHKAS